MKYISFAIPCYNSAAYMDRAVESILKGGEDVEIIIVNDGSKDDTSKIAHEYEEKYPTIVRAVDKENGGHGDAVNAGLDHAEGKYFKVVDSDDWVNEEAYQKVLETLRKFVYGQETIDMLVTNFVYEKEGAKRKKVMNYHTAFPKDKVFTWKDVKFFMTGQYILMHSVIYRTELLRQCGLELPKHTFYVDNIFAYQPLPYVKKIYYMDIDLYQYFLGRADQSVNEEVMMRRIDQQIKVTKIVASCVDLDEVRQQYPKLAVYMCRNISIMMAISSIHLLLINDKTALQKRKLLWNTIREEDKMLYLRLKYTTLSGFTYLPGKVGGKITVQGYRIARKLYQFQ